MTDHSLTGGPSVDGVPLVLDDEVEDVAAVVVPLVQVQHDVGRVGRHEIRCGRAGWPVTLRLLTRLDRMMLCEISNLECTVHTQCKC